MISPERLVSRKNIEMINEVLNFPLLIKLGLEHAIDISPQKKDKVFFVGIGTSGLTGEFIQKYYEGKLEGITVRVFRSHKMPLVSDWLYVIYSYSGTTLEVLNALKKIYEKRVECIVASTGGYLEKFARKTNIPFQKIEVPKLPRVKKLETRSHLPYGVTIFARIFKKIFRSKINVEEELMEAMKRIEDKLSNISEKEIVEIAKRIAESNQLVILTDVLTAPIARRFRNELAENSKKIAQWDTFPEMGHNLLCALFEEKARATVVVFQRSSADAVVKEYYKILEDAVGDDRIITIEVNDNYFCWRTFLEPVFIGDLLSVVVGDILGRETKPIHQVDIVKTRLKHVISTEQSRNSKN
ncbi:MAG: SIS domain-containing protein [Candidatus Njordarchaeales archaeon]